MTPKYLKLVFFMAMFALGVLTQRYFSQRQQIKELRNRLNWASETITALRASTLMSSTPLPATWQHYTIDPKSTPKLCTLTNCVSRGWDHFEGHHYVVNPIDTNAPAPYTAP